MVDDVADTGETLALVRDLMARHCADVRTAVLYAKSRSVVEPDYVWRRTDRWITFPWSALPVVSGDTPVAEAVQADAAELADAPAPEAGEQPGS